jgi:hypothetical protein
MVWYDMVCIKVQITHMKNYRKKSNIFSINKLATIQPHDNGVGLSDTNLLLGLSG